MLPSQADPFGLGLSSLHHHIIRTAQPISWSNAHQLAVIPMAPLGLQALLLQYKDTRRWRMAIGVVGVCLMLRAWMGYRFDLPELNAFNNGIGIAYLHLLIKYFEFGLLKGPYLDGYRAKGRGKLQSAIDLCINSRMVGLNLDLDQGTIGTVRPLKSKQGSKRRGSVTGYQEQGEGDEKLRVEGVTEPVHVEPWLPKPTLTRRTRTQALKRHFFLALRGIWIIDFLITLERHVASDTLGNPYGVSNAMKTFSTMNRISILPGTPFEHTCPRLLTETVVTLAVGSTVWQGLVGGYHLFATLAILAGWEVESWEVDLMNQPWKADSLLDMWGRRWHQLFRHQFLLISNCLLYPFGLAQNTTLTTALVFILSAVYHSLGELSMNPVPAIGPLSGFFLLSGVGCGLELSFKRLTGRRVHGWAGRIWTLVFLMSTARWACSSWLDSGLAGSNLGFPGPGRWIAPILAETVFKVVPLSK